MFLSTKPRNLNKRLYAFLLFLSRALHVLPLSYTSSKLINGRMFGRFQIDTPSPYSNVTSNTTNMQITIATDPIAIRSLCISMLAKAPAQVTMQQAATTNTTTAFRPTNTDIKR